MLRWLILRPRKPRVEDDGGAIIVAGPVDRFEPNSVTAFQQGDIGLAFFGGLTGVQARLQDPGAQAVAQRE